MVRPPAGKKPAPKKATPAKKPVAAKKVAGKAAPARKKIAVSAMAASAEATKQPAKFTREQATKAILEELAAGASLRSICDKPEMPTMTNFMRWLAEDGEEGDSLRQQYARAREKQAETIANEILEIADEKCVTVHHDDLGEVEIKFDSALVQDKRLRIDTRKWLMSKLAPKKYGEKTTTEHTGADGGPIQARIAVEFVKPAPRAEDD